MELKTFYAQDKYGNTIPNALVTVYLAGTDTFADNLQSDTGLPLENPFRSTRSGRVAFAAPDGVYDVVFSTNRDRTGRIRMQFFDLNNVLPAIGEIKQLVEQAEQEVADAVTAGEQAINTAVNGAENSIQQAETEAVNKVNSAATTAEQSVQELVGDAQTAATQAGQSATNAQTQAQAASSASNDAAQSKTDAEAAKDAAEQAAAGVVGMNWEQSPTKTETDERTSVLNLALPVLSNPLDFDLPRIRDALDSLDKANIRFLTLERYIRYGLTHTQALVQCAADAKRLGLEIRGSGTYNLTANVAIDGVKINGGKFVGSGTTELQLTNCDVAFADFSKMCIRHGGGDLRFNCNKVHDCKGVTAALLMQNGTVEGTIECMYNEMWNTNFAILQQGSTAIIHKGVFYKNYIHDTNGDAIELNVVNDHYDKGCFILENVIDNVDNTNSMPNWGIGIGVAGKGPYAIDMADSMKIKKTLIRGNKVTRCRQCIHVEVGTDFAILDNQVFPDASKSVNSGITFAGIVTYGCDGFIIDGVSGEVEGAERLVYVEWGSNGSTYAAPPRNFVIRNVNTKSGTVDLITSNTDAYPSEVYLSDIRCKAFRWRGQPKKVVMDNIQAESGDIIGKYASGEGSGGGIYSRNKGCTAILSNMTFVDTNGAANCKISKMSFDSLFSNNCNFTVLKTQESTGSRGTIVQPAGRIYFIDGDTFPYGMEFNQNDILYNNALKAFRVTTAGAQVNGSEQIKAAVAGQTYIASSNLNWASVHTKTAGLRLVITGAAADGTDLTVTVTRSGYVNSGEYRVDIDPPIGKDVAAGTKIRAASAVAFVQEV